MRARALTAADTESVLAALAAEPVKNVFIASRVENGVLARQATGTVYGWPGRRPHSFLHVGTNLVPASAGDDCLPAFVEAAGKRRVTQSIVGESRLVLPLWDGLSRRWGRSWSAIRELRGIQPLLAISQDPLVESDSRVQPVTWKDFDSYYGAATAMYREEVGGVPPREGYASYCRWLISTGRSYGIVSDGQVVFKTDVGATAGGVAQVQGVWLHPDLRGQGRSAPAMAAVVRQVRQRHPTVSLYVNSYNTRALRLYERVGFTQVGEFATVLY
ncbi:MAG: GNAT family N-acetyltransferase [Propionibacteriaceae bacterium]|jgi:predicted GNAT family acetyltransferase|nr:GNAT family N-acetyltransferase [Propionibacteriaceae bacterium]